MFVNIRRFFKYWFWERPKLVAELIRVENQADAAVSELSRILVNRDYDMQYILRTFILYNGNKVTVSNDLRFLASDQNLLIKEFHHDDGSYTLTLVDSLEGANNAGKSESDNSD